MGKDIVPELFRNVEWNTNMKWSKSKTPDKPLIEVLPQPSSQLIQVRCDFMYEKMVCISLIAIVIIIIIIIFEPNHSSPMLPKGSLVLRPVVPLHTVGVFMFHKVRPRLDKQTALLSFLSKTTWFVAAINYAPIIPIQWPICLGKEFF